MDKPATLNLRIDPEDRKSAEIVLSRLGLPISTAVNMFLKQVAMTGGIPFAVSLPKAPDGINADKMGVSQIRANLDEGISDIDNGRMLPAKEYFSRFKEWRLDEAL